MRCYCNRGLKRKIAISVAFSPPPRRGMFFSLTSQIHIRRCVAVLRFSPLFLIALITMCLLEDYLSLSPSDTLLLQPFFFLFFPQSLTFGSGRCSFNSNNASLIGEWNGNNSGSALAELLQWHLYECWCPSLPSLPALPPPGESQH